MPNQRLQILIKEKNIQPIRLPNNISKAIILSGPNDTRLPKQIAEEIQCTPGVTQNCNVPILFEEENLCFSDNN